MHIQRGSIEAAFRRIPILIPHIDDLGLPLIRLCFYDKVICYDHLADDFWLIALQLPDDEESVEKKLSTLTHLLIQSQEIIFLQKSLN